MSLKARKSRVLAGALSAITTSFVIARYDRSTHRYKIIWTEGPSVERMRDLAEGLQDSIQPLSLQGVDWVRAQKA